MIRRALFFISFTAAVYTLCSTADAKTTSAVAIVREPWKSCPPDVDRYTDWLPNRPKPDGEMTPVPKGAIDEIATGQRAHAIGLLEYQEVIALTRVQAMHLVENRGSLVEGVGDPYLIRNVVPSFVDSLSSPAISLNRVGSKLLIRAGLFGCGGFFKNPLVVFLPFRPIQVDMQVSAIW